MKKENKKLAQERRAAERAKKERRDKISYFLKYWTPIIGIVLATGVIIWAIATSGAKDTYSGVDEEAANEDAVVTEVESEIPSETETATLNTDTSLVAEDGQKVNIDFVGSIDGEPFEGGDSEGAGYDLVLGSDSLIDGFEDGIVGHSVGETFTLDLKFPEDYWSADFAGKDVSFEVTLNGIYQ